jgi:membrane protein
MRGRAAIAERFRRFARFAPRAVETALRAVEGEGVRLRAMALTYLSLFAFVPALVVAFSVVQAFTGMDRIAARVHEFVLDNLAVGARATIEPYLDRFVENAHATSAGIVGGALLLWSAVTLFSNVERAVNDLWGIRRRRGFAQKAVIYWAGLTLGPLLLAGSLTLSHATRAWLAGNGPRFLGGVASTLLTCAFFATLFEILPATKVRPLAAAAGGVGSGLLLEVAKSGYTALVGRFVRVHAIYGSVAAIPIFILWLFLFWTILLFGARLAFVVQYAPAVLARPRRGVGRNGREVLAAQALLEIALAFDRGEAAPDPGTVSSRLDALPEDVGEVIGALRAGGLVAALVDGGLVPARPLEQITLRDVRLAVFGSEERPDGRAGPAAGIISEVEGQAAERLAATSLRDLCDRARSGGPALATRSAAGVPGSL